MTPHTTTSPTAKPHTHMPKHNVIALTGPQGAGKTTQMKLLLEKIDAEFASVGEILRSVLPHSDKPEHKEAKEMMYGGKLIPDQVTFEILKDYFTHKKASGATKEVLIFDGFPRSVGQAGHLVELAKAYHGDKADVAVVRVTIDREEAMKRCIARAEALRAVGKEPRIDDTPKALKQRLDIYFDSIPVLDEAFKGNVALHEFDGAQQVHEVHSDMLERLFE